MGGKTQGVQAARRGAPGLAKGEVAKDNALGLLLVQHPTQCVATIWHGIAQQGMCEWQGMAQPGRAGTAGESGRAARTLGKRLTMVSWMHASRAASCTWAGG